MPIGVPIATASTVRIRLPMMGLSRPPLAPGGGVIWVKTASDSPLRPCHSSEPEDQHQPAEAEDGGAERQHSATALLRRRAA